MDELKNCQEQLHSWGRANQVLFDSGKESFHILHPRSPVGDSFRLLGVTFDPALIMKTACYEIAAVAAGRIQILLRSAKFYSRADLVCQYKSHVLYKN